MAGFQATTQLNKGKKIAIIQSNYIPWRGYFDIIASVDEFVIYDEVQYTARDWRNRNRIKTPQGAMWLTIPVGANRNRKISEVAIIDPQCGLKHWKTIRANYCRTKFYDEIESILRPLYMEPWINLSERNCTLINAICRYLNIQTPLTFSHEYSASGDRNGRLIDICKAANAGVYLSGRAAETYLDVERFNSSNISVEWVDYGTYQEYNQLWGEYAPNLSVIDLLFNCGPKSRNYMHRM